MITQKELLEKYPELLSVKKGTERMPYGWFGIESPDGWNDLLDRLLAKVEKCRPVDFAVTQIKEKFGGLRFYYANGNNEIRDLVNEAENESYRTCEKCGATGSLRDDRSWIKVLCDACNEKYPEKHR